MIDYSKQFWLDLGAALKDPEFREKFFAELEKVSNDGNNES